MSLESRTFQLDKSLVNDLGSSDLMLRSDAIAQLPEAMSRDEVSDVALQVNLAQGVEAIEEGRRLEKEVLFTIGATALIRTGDLVTAESASKELRSRHDIVGWLMIAHRLRKTRRSIVQSLTG